MGGKFRPLKKPPLWERGEIRLLPLALFLLLTFYIPVFVILIKGLQNGDGQWSLTGIRGMGGSPYYRHILLFTFTQALLSTLLSLGAALPGSWLLSHLDFPGKRLLKALTLIPFILPSILVVLGFILFWGQQGVVNRILMDLTGRDKPVLNLLYSFKAILLAHVFYNFPIALRLIAAWWRGLGEKQQQAARLMGAGAFKIFRTITLPALMPGIISAGTLIFLYCFMSFAVVLVLGGGPRLSTLEVEVYRLIKYSLDFTRGGALAFIETAATLLMTWVYIRRENKALLKTGSRINLQNWKSRSLLVQGLCFFYVLFVLLVIAGPLVTVIARSFLARHSRGSAAVFSLKWYTAMFAGGRSGGTGLLARAFENSMTMALSTMALSLVTGTAAAWILARSSFRFPGLTEAFIMMPMGVSSVVLGMGYLWLRRGGALNFIPLKLSIILAHTVIALPFVLRSLIPALKRINQDILDASRLMGRGAFARLTTLELPLIRRGLITAGAFSLAISLGEINATVILSDAGVPTIPTTILKLIGSYRFFSACALGSLLILICLGVFILIDTFEDTKWEKAEL